MKQGEPVRRKPGRPAKLSRELILAEVGKLSDAELTMPALAKVLNVETPALYHHFKSREDLLLAYGRQRFAELPVPAPNPDKWRDWFHRVNMDLFRFMLDNPLLIESGLSAQGHLAGTLQLCEAVLETLQEAGFDEQHSYWIMISMTQLTYSAARNEKEGATTQNVHDRSLGLAVGPESDLPRTAKLMSSIQKQTNAEWLDQMLRWCIDCIPDPS